MDYTDRAIWLLLGCAIGFVVGYIVRSLREIKEDVDVIMEHEKQKKDDSGVMKPFVASFALLFAVSLTVWASFQTAAVNGRLQHTIACTTKYNTHQGEALTSRDSAIKAGTASEIELWTKYGKLYTQAEKNPKRIPALQKILYRAIMAHRDALLETQETRNSFPYADPDVLKSCEENNSD